MKKPIRILAIVALSFLSLGSCKDNDQKIEDAQEDVLEAKQDVIEAKQDAAADYEEFKMKVNDKITANELKIAELKVKAIDVSKEAKANYNERIATLEAKNKELKSKIDQYSEYKSETWENFKTELDNDINQLEKDFNDVKNAK